MCIGHKNNFLQKYFGEIVFSKSSFPKTPELRFALQVLDLGCEKYFQKVYLKPIRCRTPINHKNIILKVIFLFYLKAFLWPEMVFNREKLFYCFKNI